MVAEPAPFIVGAPRSGTTLLRLMLDSHPLLAIPPETAGMVPHVAALAAANDVRVASPEGMLEVLQTYPPDGNAWDDYGLTSTEVLVALRAVQPFNTSDGMRAFFGAYAARFGKPRWGEKTPGNGASLPLIEQLLPEAHFVHLVRDGRDVAASWVEQWFRPAPDVLGTLAAWHAAVTTIAELGGQVQHYMEVRFEELVTSPRATIQRICGFLGLEPHDDMLQPHDRAAGRLVEHRDRLRADGSVLVSHADRLQQQISVTRSLDAELIGAWRDRPAAAVLADLPEAHQGLLRDLGYTD